MKLNNIGVALSLAAAMMGVSSYAGDHRRDSKAHRHAAAGMQAIPVSAKAGEPGGGWQTAVAISLPSKIPSSITSTASVRRRSTPRLR